MGNAQIQAARQRRATALAQAGSAKDIMQLISDGKVVPIISDSFRIEQIFRVFYEEENSEAAKDPKKLTISELLTGEWADSWKDSESNQDSESNNLHYPMGDKENLAHVAQYFLVEQKRIQPVYARGEFLGFLKSWFLTLCGGNPDYTDLAERLQSQVGSMRFSDIVQKLEYPIKFQNTGEDPLDLLAGFPLPIYITTSPSHFLERALEAKGKTPITQVCYWTRSLAADRRPDAEINPTEKNPLVYHLFGLEDDAQTLVLSEDDFMDFLLFMGQDTDTRNPIVPLVVRKALTKQPVLLLGYRLRDWDFRVLFRLISNYRKEMDVPRGMLIQLPETEQGNMGSVSYLKNYFNKMDFDVEWSDAEAYVQKLWNDWDNYRKSHS
ncbi:MAG TPA: SIR2 family protein [Anaerolineales bacterium]|nr:SIR2 family protein [Anaerolineales bacterium]